MLATVLTPASGGALSRGARLGVPPGHLQLDGIEGLPADDTLMVVLNQVFGELAGIGDHLLADAVLDEGLLEQDVPAVFLVGQDAPDMGCHPLCFSGDRGNSLALQGRLDLPDAVPGQIAVIDEADGLRLLRHDPWLAVGALLIAQQLLVLHGDMAGFHGLTLAPGPPATGALALGLGESPVQGDQKLALRVDGVDVLLLEDHWDTQAPQLPGEVEGVHGVAGEAGDGFSQDHVDLPLPALADHPQELLPLTGGGAGDALVREHPGHGPARFLHDLLGVVGELIVIAGELLLAVRGHPAVGRHPQVAPLLLFLGSFHFGRNDDDVGRGIVHV